MRNLPHEKQRGNSAAYKQARGGKTHVPSSFPGTLGLPSGWRGLTLTNIGALRSSTSPRDVGSAAHNATIPVVHIALCSPANLGTYSRTQPVGLLQTRLLECRLTRLPVLTNCLLCVSHVDELTMQDCYTVVLCCSTGTKCVVTCI